MLDMHPGTGLYTDGALAVGESFSDPASGVVITPLSVDDTGASSPTRRAPPAAATASFII